METIKGNFTIYVKDQKDTYLNSEIHYMDNNILIVISNDISVIYPLCNITKIVISSKQEVK